MWRILKIEFSYTKEVLIVGYLIALAFLTIGTYLADWDIYGYVWNTTIIYFITLGIVGSQAINEKRYRLFRLLPVTPSEVALVDWLYLLSVQFGMFALWFLFLFLKSQHITAEMRWALLSSNSVVLSVATLFSIHYHESFFGTKKYKRLNWLVLLTLVMALVSIGYSGNMRVFSQFVWRHYASGSGAFATFLCWIALFILSANVFVRRKSYLA